MKDNTLIQIQKVVVNGGIAPFCTLLSKVAADTPDSVCMWKGVLNWLHQYIYKAMILQRLTNTKLEYVLCPRVVEKAASCLERFVCRVLF